MPLNRKRIHTVNGGSKFQLKKIGVAFEEKSGIDAVAKKFARQKLRTTRTH